MHFSDPEVQQEEQYNLNAQLQAIERDMKAKMKRLDEKKKEIGFKDKIFQEQFVCFRASVDNYFQQRKNEHSEEDSTFNDTMIKNFVESMRSATHRQNRLGRALPEINEVSAVQEQDDVSVTSGFGSRNNSKNNRLGPKIGTPTFVGAELKKLSSRKESDKSQHDTRYDKQT